MTYVPPTVSVPTYADRKAAIIRLDAVGLKWGTFSHGLEADLKALVNYESIFPGHIVLCHDQKYECFVFRAAAPPNSILLNSVSHLISYLRQHGAL